MHTLALSYHSRILPDRAALRHRTQELLLMVPMESHSGRGSLTDWRGVGAW